MVTIASTVDVYVIRFNSSAWEKRRELCAGSVLEIRSRERSDGR